MHKVPMEISYVNREFYRKWVLQSGEPQVHEFSSLFKRVDYNEMFAFVFKSVQLWEWNPKGENEHCQTFHGQNALLQSIKAVKGWKNQNP